MEHPEEECISPFIFFPEKKVKVMYFFSFCTYIKLAEGEKGKSLPTPQVLIWPTADTFERPQVLLWLLCVLRSFVSCLVSKTGEGNSCWGRGDVGWQYIIDCGESRQEGGACDHVSFHNKVRTYSIQLLMKNLAVSWGAGLPILCVCGTHGDWQLTTFAIQF